MSKGKTGSDTKVATGKVDVNAAVAEGVEGQPAVEATGDASVTDQMQKMLSDMQSQISTVNARNEELNKVNATLTREQAERRTKNNELEEKIKALSAGQSTDSSEAEKARLQAFNEGKASFKEEYDAARAGQTAAEKALESFGVERGLLSALNKCGITKTDLVIPSLTGSRREYDISFDPTSRELSVVHRKGDKAGQPVLNTETGGWMTVDHLAQRFASNNPELVSKNAPQGAGSSSSTSIINPGSAPPTDPIEYALWRKVPENANKFGGR
jgi:hypothetical protein